VANPHRVLFLPFFYLPETWNGMDEHMLLLSRYLDSAKYEVAVLEHPGDGPQTRLLSERAGIRLLQAPTSREVGARRRLPALRRLLKQENFSLVHIHSPVAGGQLIPALAARMAGCEVVATYHQIQPWRLSRKSRLLNRLTGLLVKQTLAVSLDVRRTLGDNAGLDAKRVAVVPNGIEPATEVTGETCLPPRTPGEVRFGAFGRLSPEKGLATLLRALSLLPEDTNIRVFVAGEGPQREDLEALSRELCLGPRVTFLGFRDDARQLMQEMDAVVHVPAYEGFGLVMIEAMAAARPLVVNDAPGGMTELVEDGVNGLIVPAGDASALAGALTNLSRDPGLRQQLGANGLAICSERFSAAVVAEKVAACYEALLT
jgi:glycosyltransferase involved in cell wall biosynthesis